MELLGVEALHLVYVVYASDCISSGGLFHWKKDTGPDLAKAWWLRTIQDFLCSPGRPCQ